MAILVDKNTKVLVQGITGHEGSRATREMISYGTKVLAGVTPGKGGQKVDGIPVYNTVKEAVERHPQINTALVVVPPPSVEDAVMESLTHGIRLLDILTEHVPV